MLFDNVSDSGARCIPDRLCGSFGRVLQRNGHIFFLLLPENVVVVLKVNNISICKVMIK